MRLKFITIFIALFFLFTSQSIASELFPENVASGDPEQEKMVIWTKLNSELFIDKGSALVEYQLSYTDSFNYPFRTGTVITNSEKDFTIKVDLDGLKPNTTFYYRFKFGDEYSPVGRTKTLANNPLNLKIAIVSCQNFEAGYFTGYRYILEQNPDFIVLLGDTVYELTGVRLARRDEREMTNDLPFYRHKYRLFHSDPDLQKAFQNIPIMAIWDDHEVKNDYSGTELWQNNPQLIADAYQAYFENLPVRDYGSNQIYHQVSVGNLANLFLLDGRQYREAKPCSGRGINFKCGIKALEPGRQYLGEKQFQWLTTGLNNSDSTWNLLMNNTMMADLLFFGLPFNFDQWDGFFDQKLKLKQFINDNQILNSLVFTGDIHMFAQSDLLYHDKIIAKEFITSGLTSPAMPFLDGIRGLLPIFFPEINMYDSRYRGFTIADFNYREAKITFYGLDNVLTPDSKLIKLHQFKVKADGV